MSGQMRVDLSELEETVRKLKRVASAMEETKGDSDYRTVLPRTALGQDFTEAHELTGAHDDMRAHIYEIVTYLNDVIDDFGKKTQTTHGNVQDAEAEAKNAVSGQG